MRGFSSYNRKNIKITNIFLFQKIKNINILRFINFFDPFLYFKFIEFFKKLINIYIYYISYEVYNKYIFLSKNLRSLKCKHIKYIHFKYYGVKLKFINFFYRILYKYKLYFYFNNEIFLNYGFLCYYYLENNNYINNFIKKNILLYRILNIVLVKWSFLLFNYFHWDLNKNAHTFKNFSNPDVKKNWNFNYIKNFKFDSLIAPLSFNYFENKQDLLLKSNLISNNISKEYKINFLFNFFWNVFYKLSFIKYISIINKNINNISLSNLFLNYKYSLEFIFWEIINSNNKNYINYKYFLSFIYLFQILKLIIYYAYI